MASASRCHEKSRPSRLINVFLGASAHDGATAAAIKEEIVKLCRWRKAVESFVGAPPLKRTAFAAGGGPRGWNLGKYAGQAIDSLECRSTAKFFAAYDEDSKTQFRRHFRRIGL